MRFMVIVKANKDSEAGVLPDQKMLTEMGKFNEELVKAGVMLAGEGLQASSKGARVRFEGDKKTVIDGPFAESKELVAGFWLWQVKSKAEAIEWLKRAPFQEGEVEIRQVFEADDFGEAADGRGEIDVRVVGETAIAVVRVLQDDRHVGPVACDAPVARRAGSP
jgi:hypothetical protein